MTDIGPDYDDPADDENEVENEENADDTCHNCNGTGEGQYDGTSCRSCGGSGGNRGKPVDDDDYEPPEPEYCDEEGNRLP